MDVEQMEKTLTEGAACDEESRRHALDELYRRMAREDDPEEALWQTVLAYQGHPFYTASGLPFSYIVKRGKRGRYTGELLVTRKEGSKTLAKSSVILAFHKVMDGTAFVVEGDAGDALPVRIPPTYKGPKAIGQIFGISYVYSLFWAWDLIRVPAPVQARLMGKS
jgi:hypothetical protein